MLHPSFVILLQLSNGTCLQPRPKFHESLNKERPGFPPASGKQIDRVDSYSFSPVNSATGKEWNTA